MTRGYKAFYRAEEFHLTCICILLFMIAIAAPWLDMSVANHSFVKSYFSVLGFGFLFLLIFWCQINNKNSVWKKNHLILSLLTLFTLGTLSILWTINIDFTITKWLLWLGALFSFYAAFSLDINKNNLVRLAWGLIISASSIAVIGILQHLFDPFTLTQVAKPASTFGNKNMATQPITLILPLCFYLMTNSKTQYYKAWILATMTSMMCVFVFYTTTRASWLAIAVELVLFITFLIINRKKIGGWLDWNSNKRNASIFGVVLTLVLINLSADGFTNFLTTATSTVTEITESAGNVNSARYHIWSATLNMIKDSPFIGSGLGSFSHNLANEGYVTALTKGYQRSHNDVLELGVELGAVGLLIFLALVVSIIASIREIVKKSDVKIGFFYYTLFVALTGSFVNMQFSFPYQMPMPLILLGLYLGLIAKQYDIITSPDKGLSIRIRSQWKKLGFCFWLIAFSVITSVYVSWINAYNQLNATNTEGNYSDLSFLETPIYHKDLQSLLSRTSGLYFNKNYYEISNLIDSQVLIRWPNYINSLFRTGYGAQQMGEGDKALKYSTKLKELEPEGLFGAEIIEMLLYSATQQNDKLRQTFNWVLAQPEQLLAIDQNTYHFLLFLSLGSEELSKHAPLVYEKYQEHHGYSCEVENNIAIHYFNTEQFTKSAEHVHLAIDDKSNCLNPQLVKLLTERNLI
ncbi:MAG: O-antigen ligase family protein [Gammaproteobacteria bacterium]